MTDSIIRDFILRLVPPDGRSIGNQRLMHELSSALRSAGYPVNEYLIYTTREALINQGVLGRGRGRGGSVYLNPPHMHGQPFPQESLGSSHSAHWGDTDPVTETTGAAEICSSTPASSSIQQSLSRLSDDELNALAQDKLEEIPNVRLPRAVIENKVLEALGSFAYVADTLINSRPPAYAFLKLIMEAPGHATEADGFDRRVMERTDWLTDWVASGAGLSADKNYDLYKAMLLAAWEEGGRIDPSESKLLEALRDALRLSMREHLLLEHHPEVREQWDSPDAYERVAYNLVEKGLVFAIDGNYILPDEVRFQIRRHWGMELHDKDYRRLLEVLTGSQLRETLEASGHALSGSKDERISRLIDGLVPPSFVLEQRSLVELRQIAQSVGLRGYLPKAELIQEIITSFDHPKAVSQSAEGDRPGNILLDNHSRTLSDPVLTRLLTFLPGNQLYEISAGLCLPRAGSKVERILRLVHSGFSEYAMFDRLRREDLILLCRKIGLPVSGLKEELIERLSGYDRSVILDEHIAERHEPTPYSHHPALALPPSVPRNGRSESLPEREVPGLDYIEARYPALPWDEQLVLAYLRNSKQMNEQELRRICTRQGLGWILHKAQMRELINKLQTSAESPIRVRSEGAATLYEWVENGAAPNRIDQWAARDIINALRQGVVPERHLEMMFVGQNAARSHMLEQLEHVATGRSAFKFIRGAYGSGKTFMMAWLRDAALRKGFAVSTIRVSPEMTLSDLSDFYTGLMDGLRVPDNMGSSSLADVLDDWLLVMQRKTERVESLSFRELSDRGSLGYLIREQIQTELTELASYDPGLAPALAALYDARLSGDDDKAISARAWLRGDTSLSSAALRQLGVRGTLQSDQVLPRLRALLHLIRATSLRGLVILIDELELIRRRPQKQTRDQAYETLRALLDEVGENRLPCCLLVSTGTDAFFEDRRYGLASYEALHLRVCVPEFGDEYTSIRQPVIRLEGLNQQRLSDLADRVRDIHATAYDWEATSRVTDHDLSTLVEKWTAFGGDSIDRLPRPFLRQLVHILDICEQNPAVSPSDCYSSPDHDPEANEALMRLVSD